MAEAEGNGAAITAAHGAVPTAGSGAPISFETIMAPLGEAAFKADYLGKAPLHLEGAADKWRPVMNWEVLNRILGMTTVWSHQSLVLMLDKEPVPYTAYTTAAPGRDGGQVLRPDPLRVQAQLARGATMVLNDIDQLTPELAAFSRAMEGALGAKLQGNLYLSSKKKQGFRVHFDFHDVFAVHVMGEKTWMVFEGRAEDPIAHPAFQNLPQEHHDQAKGKLWKEVRLKPGDLLYLPRGQYHYALADEGPCAHIAFGATYPIGLDLLGPLFERMVLEPLGRANLPRNDSKALAERLAAIGTRLAALAADETARKSIAAFMAGFHYPRDTYDLPGLIERAEEAYRVKAEGLRLIEQGGRVALADERTRQAVEVPARRKVLLAWLLARERFTKSELERAFAGETRPDLARFLEDVGRMNLIEPSAQAR